MGVGIVQFGKGGHRVTSLKGCFIFFNDPTAFEWWLLYCFVFLLFFSVWVQSTGAFCELVRVVCEASEFRRESFNTRNAIVYILFVVLFIPFPFFTS